MIRRFLAAALSCAALALSAAPAAFAAPAPPVPPSAPAPLPDEDKALVDRAAAYLDALGEVRGRFMQTDARGSVTQGALYLNRPGKARFEYESPASLLVVSDGHTVAVYDKRLKTFNRYPLGATPLGLFLQRHVRLDQKVTVTRVERFSGGFSLTARDASHKSQGQITLVFNEGPLSLREWSIVDAQGARTTVRLSALESASGLDPALFVQPNPNRPAG